MFFCYGLTEINNKKTISKKYPFGKFFYGISAITNLLEKYDYKNCDENTKNNIIDEIYNKSQSDDFIDIKIIEDYEKKYFNYLEENIKITDTPELYEFIINNFKKVRLWSNPNHPSGILINKISFQKIKFILR
jgi:hypothetical protein